MLHGLCGALWPVVFHRSPSLVFSGSVGVH